MEPVAPAAEISGNIEIQTLKSSKSLGRSGGQLGLSSLASLWFGWPSSCLWVDGAKLSIDKAWHLVLVELLLPCKGQEGRIGPFGITHARVWCSPRHEGLLKGEDHAKGRWGMHILPWNNHSGVGRQVSLFTI